jgi:prepilin-type N-terminal cleavage/methylation domain-containing protein
MTTSSAPASKNAGFTLIEVMVSMTLLSVASLALGSMLFRATRQAGAASAGVQQTASLSGEVSRLDAMPFELLAPGTTCVTESTPDLSTRCTTINTVSPKVKQVTVVVTPSGNPLLQPITTTFTRTVSGNGQPLNTP